MISNKQRLIWKLSIAVPFTAVIMIAVLLFIVGITDDYSVYDKRTDYKVSSVKPDERKEINKADTPIGVAEEYTFRLNDSIRPDTFFSFYSSHHYVNVYLGKELVYSKGPADKSIIKTTGSSWTNVPVYEEDSEKTVTVELIPVYDNYRNRTIDFYLGNKYDIFEEQMRKDIPQIILCIIAVFVGVAIIVAELMNRIKKNSVKGMIFLGVFSILIGLFRITDARFAPFIIESKSSFLFYITMCAQLLCVIAFAKGVRPMLKSGSRMVMDIYCVFMSAVTIVQIIMQFAAYADLREYMFLNHVIILFGIIMYVGCLIYDRIRNHERVLRRLSTYTSIILIIGVTADIVVFYVTRTSSGLIFSLLAMLMYVFVAGLKLQTRQIDREKQLTEGRIALMMSQIKPHFIYNTLGSVEQLCEIDPEEAAFLVHNFAHYLRGNFSELDNPKPIRLSKEIEHTRNYVSIEQVRFPDIMVIFNLKSEDFRLPALTVQPLVENAIKHGLMKREKGGTVVISSYETASEYCVSVEDDGAGFNAGSMFDNEKSIGLRNIGERLRIMCEGKLSVDSVPGRGTKVVISIPKAVG